MVADGKGHTIGQEKEVSVYDLGYLGGGRLRRMTYGPWRAFAAIRSMKPTIVHFHDPELMPLGILLKGLGYKIIYDVHEDVPRQILSKDWIARLIRYPVSFAVAMLERFVAHCCDAVVSATPKIAERFPPHKTTIVQNFPLPNELETTGTVPYIERPKSFVYIGGIDLVRGACEIIQALELLDSVCSANLELVGTIHPAHLEERLRRFAGWKWVTYWGQVTRGRLPGIIGKARAGLVLFHPLANHIDAQPNKMFEYMSVGLPLIASDFPLWRRIIDGVGCGLLVDPLNPAAIAEAMCWILEHPKEAETMGQRGRKAVEQIYNWGPEASKLVNLYDGLMH